MTPLQMGCSCIHIQLPWYPQSRQYISHIFFCMLPPCSQAVQSRQLVLASRLLMEKLNCQWWSISINIYQYLLTSINIYQYLNIPISQYSNISIFQYLNNSLSQYSNIPIHQHSNFSIFQYLNIFYRDNFIQIFMVLFWQIFKYTRRWRWMSWSVLH